MLLGVSTHGEYKYNHNRKAPVEEQLLGAHIWVPSLDELAWDQVESTEHCEQYEVKDG